MFDDAQRQWQAEHLHTDHPQADRDDQADDPRLPRPAPDQAAAWAAFVRRVLGLHPLTPGRPGEVRWCQCGSADLLCPYRRIARDLGLLDLTDRRR